MAKKKQVSFRHPISSVSHVLGGADAEFPLATSTDTTNVASVKSQGKWIWLLLLIFSLVLIFLAMRAMDIGWTDMLDKYYWRKSRAARELHPEKVVDEEPIS